MLSTTNCFRCKLSTVGSVHSFMSKSSQRDLGKSVTIRNSCRQFNCYFLFSRSNFSYCQGFDLSLKLSSNNCSSPNSNRSHVTTQELIVKSELKYEELVNLKFNIASLTLPLFSDPTLKLFTGVWYRRRRKKQRLIVADVAPKRQKVETLLLADLHFEYLNKWSFVCRLF